MRREKKKDHQNMKYGDIVLLVFDEHAQTDMNKGLHSKPMERAKMQPINMGILSTKGFLENQVYVQTIPLDDSDTNFEITMKHLQEKGISNLREGLFRITPEVLMDFHGEYKKLLGTYQYMNKIVQKSNRDFRTVSMLDFLDKKLEKLKIRVKKEQEINRQKIEESKGNEILYGDNIMLQHVDSEEFLMCSKMNSLGYKVAYEAHLDHWYSSKLLLTIHSKFKSRKGGDIVQNFDEIILESSKKEYYLDVASDKPYYLNDYLIDLEKNKYRKDISFLEIRAKKFQAIYSNESKVSWRIVLFQQHSASEKEINGHDMIRVKHTELGGLLASGLRYRSSAPEVYIRNYTGIIESEKKNLPSIWEIQHIKSKFIGESINIMEAGTDENGDPLESNVQDDIGVKSVPVKFKHFLSEKYLFAVPFKEGYLMVVSNHTLKTRKKNYVKLNLTPVLSNTNKILDRKTFILRSKTYFLRFDPKIILTRKFLSQKKKNDFESTFMPLNDDDIDENNHVCKMEQGVDSENAFKIIKLSQREKMDVLFARSSLPYILYFISFFSARRLKLLKPSMYMKMEELLVKLCCFLFGVPFRMNVNIFNFDGEPDSHRQKVLRELNVIDYLTELLARPFDRGLFDIKLLKENMPITRILSMSYTTIKYIIRENRTNELYCSQWLNLFLDQSLKTKGRREIMAEKTLTELIDNNKRILTNRIGRGTVNKFIQLVSEDKVAKYIEILRVIIICNGKPLTGNQREISQLLLRDQKMRDRLMYKLRMSKGFVDVCFDVHSNNWISIHKLKEKTKFIELLNASVFDYFVSFTFLLGDLCLKRNYKAIETLQSLIPFEVCYNIVTNDMYPINIREAFTYLMTTLWVDVAPLQKVLIPNHIKFWDKNETSKFKNSSIIEKRDQCESLKVEAIQYCHSIQEYQFYEEEELKFLISMLKLLMKIIRMNLATNDEIKETFSILKSLLNTIVSIFQHESAEMGPIISFNQKSLLDKTATLICSMLKLIFLYEIDLKTSQILKNLKTTMDEMGKSNTDSIKTLFYIPSNKNSIVYKILKENTKNRKDEKIELVKKFDDIYREAIQSDFCLELHKNKDVNYLLLLLGIHSKNQELTRSTIELVYLIHSQSKLIKETFDGMQLVSDKGYEEYKIISGITNKLNDLSETCEKWFVTPNSTEQTQIAEILETLSNLLVSTEPVSSEQKKRVRRLTKSHTMEQKLEEVLKAAENKKRIHPIFTDRINCTFVATNSYHQNFFRNTGIIKSLIKILEWDLIYHQYLSVALTKKLLSSIYQILSYCCQKNQANKSYLIKYLNEPFFMHFHSDVEVGASAFVNHLLSSNTDLLENEYEVRRIIDEFFKRLDSVNSKSPLRAFILKMLGNLVNNQKKHLRLFQNMVLSRLFEKKSLSFSLDINPVYLTNWSNAIWQSEPVLLHHGVRGVIIPSELCFYLSYFDLLTICSGGKNSFSENISQNLVTLDNIQAVLECQNLHPVIKSNVIYFFFEVYLETERENFFHFQQILSDILNILIDDFCNMLDNPISVEIQDVYAVTHDQCETNSFYHYECIFRIMDCFENILKKNIKVNSSSKGFENLKNLIEYGLMYCQKFRNHDLPDMKARLWDLKNIILENTSYELTKTIEIQKAQKTGNGEAGATEEHLAKHNEEDDKKDDKLFSNILKANMKKRSRRISQKIQVIDYRKDDSVANIIQNYTNEYFISPFFRTRGHTEFKKLISFLTGIEDYNTRGLNLKNTNFEVFSKSLISFLYPLEFEDSKIHSDYLTGLIIFRLFIEQGNPKCKKGLANWDVDDWDDVQDEIVKRQTILLDLDIVGLITAILSKIDHDLIFSECMKLGVGLTIGGNAQGQKKFHESFSQGLKINTKLRSNTKGLQVLKKIKEKLDKSFNQIRNIYEEKNEIIVKLAHLDDETKRAEYEKTLTKYDIKAKRSIKSAKKIYRFLQLLCEGHNETLQNFLRQQFDETDPLYSINIDFVKYTAQTFGAFVKYINPALMELGQQLFDFMIEVVQGPCLKNQIVLFESKIVDYCKDLMNEFATDKDYKMKGFAEHKDSIENMVKWSVKLLYTLLEANRSREILQYLAFNIDFEYLMTLMAKEYIKMFEDTGLTEEQLATWPLDRLNDYLKISVFEEEVMESFDIYFLITTLSVETGAYKSDINKLSGLQKKAYEMYKYHTGQIQVVFRDENLYDVNFVIQPACRHLDDAYKQDIMIHLNRDSAKEKIIDFLNNAPKVFDSIEHLSKLLKNKKFYSPTTNLYNWVRKASLLTAILINTLIMIFFKKKLIFGSSIDDPYFDSGHWALLSLGGVHLSLGIFLFLVWTRVKAPMIIRKNLRDMYLNYYQRIQQAKEEYEGEIPDLKFKNKSIEEVSIKERISLLKQIHEILGNMYSTPGIEYFVNIIDFYFTDYDFKYIFANISISVAAIVMKQAFFFGLLLFDFIYHFDILKNIMKAITENRTQLILTSSLIFLIILIFTEFGFLYFSEDFYMSDVVDGESTCSSMFHCFLTIFALGPRSSGSIGDVMTKISYQDNQKYFVRYFFDMLIFVIVNIILMNVIFGIIIDTFAELRDKKKYIDNDIKNICSICSLNRQLFDKFAQGFEHHVIHEHNPWNYLFYIFGLRKKDSTEYDGMESYVSDQQHDEDISWIPMMRALSVKDAGEKSGGGLNQKMDQLLFELKKINKVLSSAVKFQTPFEHEQQNFNMIKEHVLLRLALFQVPFLVSSMFLFLNSDITEIRYKFHEEFYLDASPEFTHKYLQDPANFWVWMNFESPKLKYIRGGMDSIGNHFNIAYEKPNGKELVFRARLLSTTILAQEKVMQAMFQVKYLLENEFFDLTIDHNLVDSYYKDVGCSIVTYVRVKVKSRILGSSMMLGWFSFGNLLEKGYENLTTDIQKVNMEKRGNYEFKEQSKEGGKVVTEENLKEQEEVIQELLARQIDLQIVDFLD